MLKKTSQPNRAKKNCILIQMQTAVRILLSTQFEYQTVILLHFHFHFNLSSKQTNNTGYPTLISSTLFLFKCLTVCLSVCLSFSICLMVSRFYVCLFVVRFLLRQVVAIVATVEWVTFVFRFFLLYLFFVCTVTKLQIFWKYFRIDLWTPHCVADYENVLLVRTCWLAIEEGYTTNK